MFAELVYGFAAYVICACVFICMQIVQFMLVLMLLYMIAVGIFEICNALLADHPISKLSEPAETASQRQEVENIYAEEMSLQELSLPEPAALTSLRQEVEEVLRDPEHILADKMSIQEMPENIDSPDLH